MKKRIILFLLFAGFSGYSQNTSDSLYFKTTSLKADWSKLTVSDITFRFDKTYFKNVSVVSVYDLNSTFRYDYTLNKGDFTNQRVTANPVGSFLAVDRDFYVPNNGLSLGTVFVTGLFNTIFQ